MKSYREELWFETKTRRAYLNITRQVEAAIKKSGVQEGLVLVNAMHITASVYINDDEPGLLKDYDRFLEGLVPQEAAYQHNETGEDNGDAHIKRQLMGREVVVAITEGQLTSAHGNKFSTASSTGKAKTSFGEDHWIVSRMMRSRWPKRCGNDFERLLPREKFGNMDHDGGWCGRSVSIC